MHIPPLPPKTAYPPPPKFFFSRGFFADFAHWRVGGGVGAVLVRDPRKLDISITKCGYDEKNDEN